MTHNIIRSEAFQGREHVVIREFPKKSLRPHFLIAVCAVVLIGFCLMASVGGMV